MITTYKNIIISEGYQWFYPPPPEHEKLCFSELVKMSDKEWYAMTRNCTLIAQDGRLDSNPICQCSPAKKIKCSFQDDGQLLKISRAGLGIYPPLPPLSRTKKMKCLILDVCSTSDDRPSDLINEW